MPGVKGKSGGARANSGGARPGAGRPRKPAPDFPVVAGESPLEFLMRIQNDPKVSLESRLKAAITAAPYCHRKTHDGGKKDAQVARAKEVSTSRFAPASPPRLKVVAGK